ncbi:MAG: DUF4199 domain-containing protein [Mediterranea massiliensis]|nr:DUF4199 domain-containing protein [Mediterranea massiliensis]
MEDERNNIQRMAMNFGTCMGVFWILKFIMFPLGMTTPFLSLTFIILTMAVPFLGIHYARTYRNRYCDGVINVGRAFTFTWMMYLFASLLTALAHYIYFSYIDDGFILKHCEEQIVTIEQANLPNMEETVKMLKESLANAKALNAIDITMQLLSQNAFIALLMAFPTALFVAKRTTPTNNGKKENDYTQQ